MPNTMTLINSVTVGAGGAASIDFTSIPSTYTDLCVKMSLRSDATGGYVAVGYNFNASTSGYTARSLMGTGAAAESGSDTTITISSVIYGRLSAYGINTASQTASTFTSVDWYIPNYAGSTNKSSSSDWAFENNATTAYAQLVANLWSNTAAITSIKLLPSSGNFAQYSTAYLYGVKNA